MPDDNRQKYFERERERAAMRQNALLAAIDILLRQFVPDEEKRTELRAVAEVLVQSNAPPDPEEAPYVMGAPDIIGNWSVAPGPTPGSTSYVHLGAHFHGASRFTIQQTEIVGQAPAYKIVFIIDGQTVQLLEPHASDFIEYLRAQGFPLAPTPPHEQIENFPGGAPQG